MPNAARQALSRAVNRAIASGAPVYENIPATPRNEGVSIMTLSDGTVCLVEPQQRQGLDRRAFRQCGNGYEWAHLADVSENGRRARWYGYASKELPSTMTTA